MAAAHAIPELDRKGLRDFALKTGGIVVVLFGLVLPWLLGRRFPIWPWPFAAILMLWGLLAPSSLRPVYRVWMRFGLLMNVIVSPVVMSLVFFVFVTPFGVFRRMFGHDIPKHRDPTAATYRKSSRKAKPEDLERPF